MISIVEKMLTIVNECDSSPCNERIWRRLSRNTSLADDHLPPQSAFLFFSPSSTIVLTTVARQPRVCWELFQRGRTRYYSCPAGGFHLENLEKRKKRNFKSSRSAPSAGTCPAADVDPAKRRPGGRMPCLAGCVARFLLFV